MSLSNPKMSCFTSLLQEDLKRNLSDDIKVMSKDLLSSDAFLMSVYYLLFYSWAYIK